MLMIWLETYKRRKDMLKQVMKLVSLLVKLMIESPANVISLKHCRVYVHCCTRSREVLYCLLLRFLPIIPRSWSHAHCHAPAISPSSYDNYTLGSIYSHIFKLLFTGQNNPLRWKCSLLLYMSSEIPTIGFDGERVHADSPTRRSQPILLIWLADMDESVTTRIWTPELSATWLFLLQQL